MKCLLEGLCESQTHPDGNKYQYSSGPDGVTVSPSSSIVWEKSYGIDGNENVSWKICWPCHEKKTLVHGSTAHVHGSCS